MITNFDGCIQNFFILNYISNAQSAQTWQRLFNPFVSHSILFNRRVDIEKLTLHARSRRGKPKRAVMTKLPFITHSFAFNLDIFGIKLCRLILISVSLDVEVSKKRNTVRQKNIPVSLVQLKCKFLGEGGIILDCFHAPQLLDCNKQK